MGQVFWPNRKSKNGSRALSRVPRRHRVPAWSTMPPVMKTNDLADQGPSKVDLMRGILVDLVGLVIGPDQSLDDVDDTRLVAVAREALTTAGRVMKSYRTVEADLKSMRQELDRFRADVDIEGKAIAEAKKAVAERDDIAVKFKELQKQVDPEKRQLEIMYAIDEATATLKDEVAQVRRELGQRQTEIESLRASKKRLREALDRLAGKD